MQSFSRYFYPKQLAHDNNAVQLTIGQQYVSAMILPSLV